MGHPVQTKVIIKCEEEIDLVKVWIKRIFGIFISIWAIKNVGTALTLFVQLFYTTKLFNRYKKIDTGRLRIILNCTKIDIESRSRRDYLIEFFGIISINKNYRKSLQNKL